MTGRERTPAPGLRTAAASLVGVAVAVVFLQWQVGGALPAPPLGSLAAFERWVTEMGAVVAAVAVLRLAVLAAGWYVLAVATVGLTLRALRAYRLVALADRLTVPPLRRLLAGTLSLGLASSGLTGIAIAASAGASTGALRPSAAVAAGPATATPAGVPGPVAIDDAADDDDAVVMRRIPDGEPAPGSTGSTPPASADSPAPPTTAWTVAPGDSFWRIAEFVLGQAWSRPPSDAELVPYWQSLIEANRGVLADRSNPDLIYPGQEFTIPPPPPELPR